jgi:hypothetical protein
VALTGSDHVIVGTVLLQHQPHHADIVAGKAPVALRVQIADREAVCEAELIRATPSDTFG